MQNRKKEYTYSHIGLGGVISSFQDIKYSNVRYNGTGALLSFGFEKKRKHLWGFDISLIYTREKVKTHDSGQPMMLIASLNAKYLLPVLSRKYANLYVGGSWEIVDLDLRFDSELYNHSITYISNSGIKLSSLYETKISQEMKLGVGVDFQVFGFVKEIPSFAVIGSQEWLERGEFSYQNLDVIYPYNLKYYTPEPFWDYTALTTSVKLHYKTRWAFSYEWNMQRSNRVKNYPLTRGYSSISVLFKISNKKRK